MSINTYTKTSLSLETLLKKGYELPTKTLLGYDEVLLTELLNYFFANNLYPALANPILKGEIV